MPRWINLPAFYFYFWTFPQASSFLPNDLEGAKLGLSRPPFPLTALELSLSALSKPSKIGGKLSFSPPQIIVISGPRISSSPRFFSPLTLTLSPSHTLFSPLSLSLSSTFTPSPRVITYGHPASTANLSLALPSRPRVESSSNSDRPAIGTYLYLPRPPPYCTFVPGPPDLCLPVHTCACTVPVPVLCLCLFFNQSSTGEEKQLQFENSNKKRDHHPRAHTLILHDKPSPRDSTRNSEIISARSFSFSSASLDSLPLTLVYCTEYLSGLPCDYLATLLYSVRDYCSQFSIRYTAAVRLWFPRLEKHTENPVILTPLSQPSTSSPPIDNLRQADTS